MVDEQHWDVIVVGAGAAGLMCAAEAGLRGRRVLLLDHAAKIGERIRISGGGRCNFTNLRLGPENYLSQNPHFVRSALSRYRPQDFIDLIDLHGIAWQERKHGQLFCRDSAKDLVALLLERCQNAGVTLRHPVTVQHVAHRGDRYYLQTNTGAYATGALVVATGGLAVPKLGATPWGYRIAEQFGIDVVPPQPALVPLALPAETLDSLKDLSGVSLATATHFVGSNGCPDATFMEDSLITHRGLSGPAILQISSYWQMQAIAGNRERVGIDLNLVPQQDVREWLKTMRQERGSATPAQLLAEYWPKRFAIKWCALHGWQDPIGALSNAQLDQLVENITQWSIKPSGTLGYAKAEVTLGGVDTRALSSKTMEARTVRGLYFIGEVVDVTGWLGGYNFQWAWSSGWVAGQFV